MTPEQEVALDIVQITLDLAGIIEPTPTADGTNLLISLGRRQWFNAAISGVSMVPYLGDMAKFGKLPHYVESVVKAVQLAAKDERFAAHLRPAFAKLKALLDKLPLQALPPQARAATEKIIHEVNAFLHSSSSGEKFFEPFADFPRFEGKSIKNVLTWLRENGFHEVQAPSVTVLGKTKQSQIWFRRHPRPGGADLIEAVRIDARGHNVPAHIPREAMQPHRLTTIEVASGEPRHMHKELIDSTMESAYTGGGIKKNGKHWTPPSFNDHNHLSTGDHRATHIWLIP
jgi:hypothetical protein